jgi:hypothetical protein
MTSRKMTGTGATSILSSFLKKLNTAAIKKLMISTNSNLKKPSKLKGQQLQQEIRL